MSSNLLPIQAVVFDMGDVLFTWNPKAKTTITPENIRSITSSPLWHDFERGLVTATECYHGRGSALGLCPDAIASTFQQTTASLTPHQTMTALVRELKSRGLAVYMMTNIPRVDYDALRAMEYVWELFDGIFASGYLGMRKPDGVFYEFVLGEVGAGDRPGSVIFVDDKLENVDAARRSGMVGVHFQDVNRACADIRALIDRN